MARVLITGGKGFIGSHLTDLLQLNNHQVSVIDDLSGGFEENSSSTFYQKDCRDAQAMDEIFRIEKPEVVFHLAANAAEAKSAFSPIDITSRNYSAFINTLTPFIKYGGKRIVFTSSIAVYGAGQVPFQETDQPEPEDLYGVTKLAAEQTLKIMADVHGFEYVIARPHNVYGPRQNMTDPYRNVMTIWMNAMLRNEPYYIYGDGTMQRCFSYIDDVIGALYKCGFDDVSGKTFNIGSDKAYSLEQLSWYLQPKHEPLHLPKRPHEVQEAISDHTECKNYLGYYETALPKGIAETWKWCKKQGPQTPLKTGFEIMSDKIPANWL